MIEKRIFGRTSHLSTCTIFGGASLSQVTQADAESTLNLLLEYGVNHIDTANSYGESEKLIGPWLARHRQEFFLATKTGDRTYQGAKAHLQRSLNILHTDYIDLWQIHNLVDPQEWEVAMGAGGVLEAFVEAKQQGFVRFLGVTGHGTITPSIHKRSLEQFDFDSVLLPCNFVMLQNPQYAADFEELAALCQERNVAVQTIKSIARGPWGSKPQNHTTWYEPLEEQAEIDKAVHWLLNRPGFFLNTVGDIHLLPKVLDAASRFKTSPSETEMMTQTAALELTPLFVE